MRESGAVLGSNTKRCRSSLFLCSVDARSRQNRTQAGPADHHHCDWQDIQRIVGGHRTSARRVFRASWRGFRCPYKRNTAMVGTGKVPRARVLGNTNARCTLTPTSYFVTRHRISLSSYLAVTSRCMTIGLTYQATIGSGRKEPQSSARKVDQWIEWKRHGIPHRSMRSRSS